MSDLDQDILMCVMVGGLWVAAILASIWQAVTKKDVI